jgi:hypothetical protein
VVPLALALASPGLGSCGLIDSDVTDFNLKLPEKNFNVDTADWMLSVTGTMPSIDCSATDCSGAADTFCAQDRCTADCDANAECQAHVAIAVFQPFDLANESPELAEISSKPIARVTVEAIAFSIKENTLTVASPPLELYLAPQGVSDPTSAEAQHIGTLAPVEPATTGDAEVVLTDSGKDTMAAFMKDYETPFTVIVAGEMTLQAGDPVPQGKLSGVVTVTAHAGL